MRKALLLLVVGLFAAAMFTGCAMVRPAPVNGFWYTNLQASEAVTSNVGSTKVGTAKCTSILGLIATGDASISAAAQNGGVTKIHHVDFKAESILGIFATYTVMVYGE